MRRTIIVILIALVPALFIASEAGAQEPVYKEYTPSSSRAPYFTLGFNKQQVWILLPSDTTTPVLRVERSEIDHAGATVTALGKPLFSDEGLLVNSETLPYDRISDIEIERRGQDVSIRFFTNEKMKSQPGATKRGNRITYDRDIEVPKEDFVRGVIFTVKGDVDVLGEANKDVVSLFGDIHVEPSAVVRGDVAGITGSITVARAASVYGDTYSGTRKSSLRRHRFYRKENPVSLESFADYDRVDGLGLTLGVRHQDPDSNLPTAWLQGGYAFASERWRFSVGIEQTLWRSKGLVLGGDYYRRLASNDDWLIDNTENSIFAIMFNEDYKDFWEADGGSAYLKISPVRKTSLEVRLRAEQTNWLRAHRNLWSVFGGSKLFPENYSGWLESDRPGAIAETDTTTNVTLSTRLEYDTRDKENIYGRSAWKGFAQLEYSDGSLGSDFDYRKYLVTLRRYQVTTRYTMLLLSGTYGASDGYLPLYKRYFMGGVGTLYGYDHHEYMGTRFWMTNAEYRFGFPKSDLGFSLFWDAGQITNGASFSADSQVKNSLGVAVYIGNDLRLSVSRRLDRSTDNSPKIYARLGNVF